jgi:quercetin dioxygenase-like cupin family protein
MRTLKRLAPVLTIVAVMVVVAIAMATPPSGQHPSAVVSGTLSDPIHVNTDRIKFQTKDQTDISSFTVTYDPSGFSGWHTHPGIVIATIQSGSVVRTVDCRSTVYSAGDSFIESDEQPAGEVRNASVTQPAVIYVTQIVPHGSARRIDADPPSC